MLRRVVGRLTRGPVRGVVGSLAIHTLVLALVLLFAAPPSPLVVKRGEPVFIELPDLPGEAPAGNPAARTPGAPAPEVAARPSPPPRPAAPSAPERSAAARPTPRPAAPPPPPPRPESPAVASRPPEPGSPVASKPESPPVPSKPDAPAVASKPEPPTAEKAPEPPAVAARPELPAVATRPESPPAAGKPEPPVVASRPPERAAEPAESRPAEPTPEPAEPRAPSPPSSAAAPAPRGPSPGGPQVAAVPPAREAPPIDIRSFGRGGGGGGRGDGRAGIEGEPVPLDSPDPRYSDYLDHVRRKIKANWGYPCVKNHATRECEYKTATLTIEFGIAKDGRVPFVNVVRSSGWAIYDDYAVNAIKFASPFRPVPDALGKKGFPILARFNYLVDTSLTNILK